MQTVEQRHDVIQKYKERRRAARQLPVADTERNGKLIADWLNTYCGGVVSFDTLDAAIEALAKSGQLTFEITHEVAQAAMTADEQAQKAQAELAQKQAAEAQAREQQETERQLSERRALRQSRQDNSGPGRLSAGESAQAVAREKAKLENDRRKIVAGMESAASYEAFKQALQQARRDAHGQVHSRKQDRFNELAVAIRQRWPEFASEITLRP